MPIIHNLIAIGLVPPYRLRTHMIYSNCMPFVDLLFLPFPYIFLVSSRAQMPECLIDIKLIMGTVPLDYPPPNFLELAILSQNDKIHFTGLKI